MRTAEKRFAAESVAYTATGIYDGSERKKIDLPRGGLNRSLTKPVARRTRRKDGNGLCGRASRLKLQKKQVDGD
jgi:hypothetical protein